MRVVVVVLVVGQSMSRRCRNSVKGTGWEPLHPRPHHHLHHRQKRPGGLVVAVVVVVVVVVVVIVGWCHVLDN